MLARECWTAAARTDAVFRDGAISFSLSQSEYADRFVLKGALMFRVWGAPQSRATRDIDLLARAENSVQSISAMMKDVCRQSVESRWSRVPRAIRYDGSDD